MTSLNVTTDSDRRLAMQIAIQLPHNVDEARLVLGLTSDLLDNFLVEVPSGAHRRAQLLGWGLGRPVEIEAPAPRPRAALALATLLALGSLLVTMPVGLVLLKLCGLGAGVTFLVGVALVALVLGTVPALALAIITPLAHNLLLVPPALEFSAPTTGELVAAGGYLVLALTVPWIAARRTKIRDAVIRPPPVAVEPPRIRMVG